MINKTKNRKAFTLLEVLIATGIFSMVMALTTGIVSFGAGYQSKIQVLRNVSFETQKIGDGLARDIRASEGTFKAKINNIDTNEYEFINGLALLKCDPNTDNIADPWTCQFAYNDFSDPDLAGPVSVLDDPKEYKANALIIFSKDRFIIYLSLNNQILSKGYNLSDLGDYWDNDQKMLFINNPANPSECIFQKLALLSPVLSQVSDADLEDSLGLSGFIASKQNGILGTKLQTYISYYVFSRTKDYDTLKPTDRAESYLRSTISTRNLGS